MDIITMARNLGTEIQKTEEYKQLVDAKNANEADALLNDQIGQFNLVKLELQSIASQEQPDQEKLDQKNQELQQLYQAIMENENMMAFQQATNTINAMMNQINRILTTAINGGDPQTCSTDSAGCPGSCESCSGCH